MKVTFTKEELSAAISLIMGCSCSKSTIPAIEGILITAKGENHCKLCTYDLEKGMRVDVSSRNEESGSVIINAQKLAMIVRSMPGDVTVETEDEKNVKIKSGKSEFSIGCLPGSEFPSVPEFMVDRSFEMETSTMKNMLNATSYAVAHDEQRIALTGVNFRIDGQSAVFVACDGFRLAVKTKKIDTKLQSKAGETAFNFIVPLKTVNELTRLLDCPGEVKTSLTRKHIVFAVTRDLGSGDTEITLFSRLIDTPYIEYTRFIPTESKIFVNISRDELREALERAALVADDKTGGQIKRVVKFTFEDDVLNITANSSTGKTYEEVGIKKTGDDITIGFNCRYLLEALKACDDEELRLSLSSPLMSMIIEGAVEKDEEGFLSLALPIRMKENN